MKTLLPIITVLLFNIANAQCEKAVVLDMSKLVEPMKSKLDTIYFVASYVDFGETYQQDYIESLGKKAIINKSKYHTALAFVPEGSSNKLYLPIKENKKLLSILQSQKYDSKIKLCVRGVRIKGYESYNNKPFFLVDRVWVE